MTAIRYLTLSNCRLYELQPDSSRALNNLNIFGCDNCHLHYVDPEFILGVMANVRSLFFRRNFIRTLELLRSREPLNLKYLSISHNLIENITRADLAHVPKLESLILEYNKIKTIEDGAFDQITSLEELNLGHNCILRLPDHPFHGSIKSIVLSYNLLTRFPIPNGSHYQVSRSALNNLLIINRIFNFSWEIWSS